MRSTTGWLCIIFAVLWWMLGIFGGGGLETYGGNPSRLLGVSIIPIIAIGVGVILLRKGRQRPDD